MTPARNNVRATRHFGIPARKSSPNNSPILAKPRKTSPSTPLQPFPREKTRPTTAQSWPNREKTRPARPKTPKSSHFSRAGRTFSRFQRRTTEQGDFSPATTPLNTHHRDTTTPTGTKPTQQRRRQRAQPGARVSTRDKTLPARPQSTKTGHFSRAGRIFSRSQHRATEQGEFSPATTPLNTHHRDTTTPTGTKPTQQRRRQRAQPGTRVNTRYKTLPALPPQSPTGTKLSPQHPPQGTTGTKLSRHAQQQRKLAISREHGESFPVPNAAPPSRENFLPQQHHSIPITGTPPPNHHPNR